MPLFNIYIYKLKYLPQLFNIKNIDICCKITALNFMHVTEQLIYIISCKTCEACLCTKQ